MPIPRHAAPDVTMRRGPSRWYSEPATNDVSAKTPIIGSSPAPDFTAENPRTFVMNCGR